MIVRTSNKRLGLVGYNGFVSLLRALLDYRRCQQMKDVTLSGCPTFFIIGRDLASVIKWTSSQDKICAECHSINPVGMFRQCPNKLAL